MFKQQRYHRRPRVRRVAVDRMLPRAFCCTWPRTDSWRSVVAWRRCSLVQQHVRSRHGTSLPRLQFFDIFVIKLLLACFKMIGFLFVAEQR